MLLGNTVKTIAIVGRGKTSKYAPFDNPDVDIWAFNDNAMTLPRLTAAFEMHPDWADAPRLNDVPGITEYREWLQQPHDFYIYMHEPDPRVPSSVRYPRPYVNYPFKNTLMKGAGQVEDFYTSTTPYALALAVLYQYPRIELYGIELTQETEYREHRDSVFFWIGRATGVGIEVWIHEEGKLYQPTLYPLLERTF